MWSLHVHMLVGEKIKQQNVWYVKWSWCLGGNKQAQEIEIGSTEGEVSEEAGEASVKSEFWRVWERKPTQIRGKSMLQGEPVKHETVLVLKDQHIGECV